MLIDPIRYAHLFPEIARFGTKRERWDAMWAAQLKAMRTWGFWLFPVVLVSLGFAFSFFFLPILVRSLGNVGFLGPPLLLLLLAGPMPGEHLWVCRRVIQLSLREQLIERGERVCLQCGYDLRGQDDPRCPECGEAFVRSC